MSYPVACFACTTPYQLLGAIAIVQETNVQADLYLFGMFPDYELIASRIRDYKIFCRVFPVDCSKYRKLSKIKSFWQIIHSNREVKNFLDSSIDYNIFYSSSKAHPKLLLFYELRRRNPNIIFSLYEDGTGTYNKYSTTLHSSIMRRVADWLNGGSVLKKDRTIVMVHYPELLCLPKKLEKVPQLKMPSLFINHSNQQMLRNLFNIRKEDSIYEDIIVFDTGRGAEGKKTFDLNLLDQCFDAIIDVFSYQSVICKLHPRSLDTSKSRMKIYKKKTIPMEILYADMNSLDNRILIGNHTTALYTPKMLFNKEPIVISLHNIVWKANPHVHKVFERFRSMYSNKERIVAPNSIEEMKVYLKKIQI